LEPFQYTFEHVHYLLLLYVRVEVVISYFMLVYYIQVCNPAMRFVFY